MVVGLLTEIRDLLKESLILELWYLAHDLKKHIEQPTTVEAPGKVLL